jgi:glycosyltransferase involved in cell wall biosynthesis
LSGSVTFAPAVPSSELPEHYRRCAVHVNLTPAGFGDKVAWEAMSCARPCLVANNDLRETLDAHTDALFFRPGDAPALARKMSALLAMSSSQRAAIGGDLRRQVEHHHSLPGLAERILAELGGCARQPSRAQHLLPTEALTAR